MNRGGWRQRLSRLRGQRSPIRYLIARTIPLCGNLFSFVTVERRGYRLRLYPTSASAALWYDRDDFTTIENFFWWYLRPGDIVVDVGANIGTTALTASTVVGSAGHVIAIEAHPRTFRYLQGNVELNGRTNMDLVNLAVGDVEGTIAFSDSSSDEQNAVQEQGGIAIPMRPLDAIVTIESRIALIKIDVEGYELPVLRGAAAVLQQTDCLVFEADNAHYEKYGYRIADVVTLLAEHGLHTFQLCGDGSLARVESEYVGASLLGGNLLAARDPDMVAGRLASGANRVFTAVSGDA